MDLLSLIMQMEDEGVLRSIATNPLAQFGTRTRRYLGATLLPERPVEENAFTEEQIRYRTFVANAATRYSPVQLKQGVMAGSMNVQLANSDIGSEFSGREYDALLRLLRTDRSMDGMMALVRFLTTTVNLPLVEWNERARWQAIVNAVVQLRGDNGYSEDVNYSNPAGHRAAAAAAWSNDATDPYDDIIGMANLLEGKGFSVSRIITSRQVVGILSLNAIMRARTNKITINAGAIEALAGRVDRATLNAIFAADGLPPIETYDLQYRTQQGTGRFMPADVMVFVASTGRDESIDYGDQLELLPDTLGYTAIGRPVGQANSGRVIISTPYRNKPPRIENEGWQTSLPVITEPEAVAVITGIS